MKPSHLTLIALRHSTKHPVQSLLLILGIALGVAMIVAIDVANSSAKQAFTLSTDSVAGKATHQIIAQPGDLPSDLFQELRIDLGLREIAPVVKGLVLLTEADDLPLDLLGIEPFSEGPFRDYLGDGESNLSFAALDTLLTEPNTVFLPRDLAEQYGFEVGQTLTVFTNGQTRSVKLAALLNGGSDLNRRALQGVMLTDISTAQEVLGQIGGLSHIDLILPPDGHPTLTTMEEAETAINAILPPNARLERATVRTQTATQMIAAFELNLTALSFLALIVGMFLIYNTISFSVVQRRPILGSLRCLGVTRREIFGLVLTEALVLSTVGALIGLALGVVLGRALVVLVSQTINDLFFTSTVTGVTVTSFTLYKGFVAGVGAGLLAAFIPALEATTVPPNSTLKRSSREDRAQRMTPVVTLVGVGVIALGWGLLTFVPELLFVSFGGVMCVLVGAALTSPLVTRTMMTLIRPLTQQALGIIGVMAPRDIVRSLSRTSVTVAALMLAVSVIIGVSVMVDSFRTTVVLWLDDLLQADIYISPVGQGERVAGAIDDEAIALLGADERVAVVGLQQSAVIYSPALGEIELRTNNPQPNQANRPLMWTLDNRSAEEMLTLLDQGDVAVSEIFARRLNLPLDQPSTVSLQTDQGLQDFRIVGVFYDYSLPEKGYLWMGLDTYHQFWNDTEIDNVGLYLAPDYTAQADEITEGLRMAYAGEYGLSVTSNRGLKQGALDVFDRTFTITSALRLLATLVAFIGVLSALMSLQLERTRELGTLRANGMSISQLWQKTFLETGLLGLTAGLMAIPTGLVLAVILLDIINLRSFGWTLQLYINPTILLGALGVAIVAALLAGLYPVWRLNNMQIAAALREE